MTDQELFKKLKRDGECWQTGDPRIQRCSGKDRDTGESVSCRISHDPQELNPDFSTPDGFFWLWERAIEKDWWERFILKTNGLSLDEDGDLINNCLPVELIHRTRFTEALKEYLNGRN